VGPHEWSRERVCMCVHHSVTTCFGPAFFFAVVFFAACTGFPTCFLTRRFSMRGEGLPAPVATPVPCPPRCRGGAREPGDGAAGLAVVFAEAFAADILLLIGIAFLLEHSSRSAKRRSVSKPRQMSTSAAFAVQVCATRPPILARRAISRSVPCALSAKNDWDRKRNHSLRKKKLSAAATLSAPTVSHAAKDIKLLLEVNDSRARAKEREDMATRESVASKRRSEAKVKRWSPAHANAVVEDVELLVARDAHRALATEHVAGESVASAAARRCEAKKKRWCAAEENHRGTPTCATASTVSKATSMTQVEAKRAWLMARQWGKLTPAASQ